MSVRKDYAQFRLMPLIILSLSAGVSAHPLYGPSSHIIDIEFDESSRVTLVPDSDQWTTTWCNDDSGDGHLYSVWGDGDGFGSKDASIGVARFDSPPPNVSGTNVWSAARGTSLAGKSKAVICVDGEMYMLVAKQGEWTTGRMGRSVDYGRTWEWTGYDWQYPFPDGAFVQFGKDYEGARDEYMYILSYADDATGADETTYAMARVPKTEIMNWNAWEFYAGMTDGQAVWTSDITQRRPIFEDPQRGTSWGAQISYNPVLKRYILTTRGYNQPGQFVGFYDAPEPWGPWTVITEHDPWLDTSRKHVMTFSQHPDWMASNGVDVWITFGRYDDINFIAAKLITSAGGGAVVTPSPPEKLATN